MKKRVERSVEYKKSNYFKIITFVLAILLVLSLIFILFKLINSNITGRVVDEQESMLEGMGMGIMANGTAVDDLGNVYQCGIINQSGSYTLNQSINSNGTCINVNSSNVILNGNGYNLNYSQNGTVGYGIYVSGYNNITIKNLNIYEGNSSGNYKYAILFSRSNYSTIINNNITTISGVGTGIYLDTLNSNNITLNNILTNGSNSEGIYLCGIISSISNSNIINSNTITLIGSVGYGINLFSYADLNNLTLNTITTTGLSSFGFNLGGISGPSRSNIISSNILNISRANRINLQSSSLNNSFINNLIINRNYSYNDISFVNTAINGTWFIDQPLENYTFTGTGGIINVKNSQYGQIIFNVPVNGSGTNFSNDIQIGNNSVYVNSSQIGLNKSANITLFNLPIINYITSQSIYRDGTSCNSTTIPQCFNLTNLNESSVGFNVSSWSNYSIYRNYDTTSPVVTLSSPSTGASYPGASSNITFVFDATDGFTGIVSCSLYLNTASYSNTTAIVGSGNSMSKVVSTGTYNVSVNCTDLAGNVGNSSNITITVRAVTTPTVDPTPAAAAGGATITNTSTSIVRNTNTSRSTNTNTNVNNLNTNSSNNLSSNSSLKGLNQTGIFDRESPMGARIFQAFKIIKDNWGIFLFVGILLLIVMIVIIYLLVVIRNMKKIVEEKDKKLSKKTNVIEKDKKKNIKLNWKR